VIVKVEVKQICSAEIKSLNVSLENLPSVNIETYNSGSLSYHFRVSIEGKNRVWSQKVFTAPGDLKRLTLHFLPSNKTKIKIHYCDKVFEKEIESKEIEFKNEDWFYINFVRVYSNFLVAEIISNVSTEAVIMPFRYPENLIIENYVGKLKVGKNFIRVGIEGDLAEDKMIFVVASIDGRYFSKSEARVEKPVGLKYWLFYFIDTFRVFVKISI